MKHTWLAVGGIEIGSQKYAIRTGTDLLACARARAEMEGAIEARRWLMQAGLAVRTGHGDYRDGARNVLALVVETARLEAEVERLVNAALETNLEPIGASTAAGEDGEALALEILAALSR